MRETPPATIPIITGPRAADPLPGDAFAAVADLRARLDAALIGLLAGGHVLLKGAPRLAKTHAVRRLAQGLAGRLSRIQCTPDLMLADLTGTPVFRPDHGDFAFAPGAVVSRRRGLEAADNRLFVQGDAPRHVNRNVTARTGKPHVRSFHDERALATLLIADFCAPRLWGARTRFCASAAALALTPLGCWRATLSRPRRRRASSRWRRRRARRSGRGSAGVAARAWRAGGSSSAAGAAALQSKSQPRP